MREQGSDNMGPPPVLNKRFADLKASDGDDTTAPRSSLRSSPPPLVSNSRFAAAAEMDRRDRPDERTSRFGGDRPGGNEWSSRFGSRPSPDTQGPPPVAHSRFAKAAEMAERDDRNREDRRGMGGFSGTGGSRGFGGDRGPRGYDAPLAQNSRFANAAADDPDYVERGERERRMQDRERERAEGRGDRGPGGFRNDRYGGGGARAGAPMVLPKGPRGSDSADGYNQGPSIDLVDELLKPKLKKEDEVVIKPPTKLHEENILKFPAKALTKEEDNLFPTKKKEPERPAKQEPSIMKQEPVADVEELMAKSEELLKEFISGSRQGDELTKWVQENKVGLPAVEKLLFELLMEKEKLNPDPECSWAEPSKFGGAFLSLVEDDLVAQMQILWGIQLYCDKIGFPKLDGESVCQAMFRSMYKYDLASGEAFTEWKEDESDNHMAGKTNAIIQTTDWFAWLEEDDEEDEDEEY